MKHLSVNHTKGVVICHGKSEIALAKYISTNLRLPIKIHAKDHGKHSIQITSVMTVLNTRPFKTIDSFLSEYEVEVSGKGNSRILHNFKLFIIMDTDDCTDQQRDGYIGKELFRNHWLYDYIVPIYNIRKLEEVLMQAGIMTKKIKSREKGEYYDRIFPINRTSFSVDSLNEVNTFNEKIRKVKTTNLECFVDYCLSLLERLT